MAPRELSVEVHEGQAWPQVAEIWAGLAAASPYTTFSISPEWTESWLEVFGPSLRVEILVFRHSGVPVGACLLVRRNIPLGPFRVRCVYVNAAGEDDADSPVIEFNNLLCLRDWEQAVADALISQINRKPWDEIRLNGFCQGPPLDAIYKACSGLFPERIVRATFLVNLRKLRESGTAYESVLGAKHRKRLSQNLRAYGETTVEVPQDSQAALKALRDLADLHTRSWQSRDQAGAFISAPFRAFHEGLIRRGIGAGQIQLARVQSALGPVGILYNMIYRGRVYFYQSGFFFANKKVSPGLVCLARTIRYCLERPQLEEFHLMAGGDHYKEPLSTERQELEWAVLLKPTLKNRAIRWLRQVKRRHFPRAKPAEVAES